MPQPRETFTGEQGPGAVTQQPLQRLALEGADAHLGIEGESAAMGPLKPLFSDFFPLFCKQSGNEMIESSLEDGKYHFYIRKS